MTIVHQEQNYLEGEYLNSNYLTSHINGALGFQFEVIIDKQVALASQYKTNILDSLKSLGIESEFIIASEKGNATQYSVTINKETALATQFLTNIADYLNSLGVEYNVYADGINALGEQYKVTIENKTTANGLQYNADLTQYDSTPIQFNGNIVDYKYSLPIEYKAKLDKQSSLGLQYKTFITNRNAFLGVQFESIIDKKSTLPLQYTNGKLFHQWGGYLVGGYLAGNYLEKGMFVILPIQYNVAIQGEKSLASQYNSVISSRKYLATQYKVQIDKQNAIGIQFLSLSGNTLSFQYRVSLYNTNNLRILCDFPSRGIAPNNWSATSTASGDFDISNVNNDIVENVWRSNSGAISGISLICDTGLPQGVYLDTLALLNHNLTTSAEVQLLGSNDAGFATIGVTISFTMTIRNYIYIASELPTTGFRYWKIVINDNTNPDGYLQIGTIIFGESTIFQGECFANPISYKKTHYSDQVITEGFTSVNNDRGIKSKIGLSFEKLNFSGGNYNSLVNIFETARTNLKCLWVPTPQYPTRYSVFGKLTELPQETHNDMGINADYVDLNLEVDEAK